MDELIKFRAYSYTDEKIDTFSFNPKKDVKVNKKLVDKDLTVTVSGKLAEFLREKAK